MKKILCILVVVVLTGGCISAPTVKSSNQVGVESLGIIAVMPFNGFRGDQFADLLTQEFIMSGARVVERSKVIAILMEQGLSVVDIAKGNIKYDRLEGLLGVDTIVVGSVSPITVYNTGAKSEKVSTASIRLVTIKTGIIIGAASYSANTDLLMGSKLYPKVAEMLVNKLIRAKIK